MGCFHLQCVRSRTPFGGSRRWQVKLARSVSGLFTTTTTKCFTRRRQNQILGFNTKNLSQTHSNTIVTNIKFVGIDIGCPKEHNQIFDSLVLRDLWLKLDAVHCLSKLILDALAYSLVGQFKVVPFLAPFNFPFCAPFTLTLRNITEFQLDSWNSQKLFSLIHFFDKTPALDKACQRYQQEGTPLFLSPPGSWFPSH